MSLIPLMFSDWWEDLKHPHQLLDQHFGMGLRPEQLFIPKLEAYIPHDRRHQLVYNRPWAHLLRPTEEGGFSTVKADKDQFQVVLDVQQFKPDEIDVKVVDNCVVVTAKHEEKRDEHGWISRQFVRKYLIPDQCNIDQVSSRLSSDGILTINAPRKIKQKEENEKTIKIIHTGKPAIRPESKPQQLSKKDEKEEPKDDKKE